MKKPIAVCFADSHLQERAWAGRPIEGDSYYSFKQIIDYAVSNRIKTVIGAGDLIDRQQNRAMPIVVLGQQLERLDEFCGLFYYIQGQHELEQTPWLASFSNARHLHRNRLQLGPLVACGIDYQTADNLRADLELIPQGTDILFAHQTWTDFMGEKAATQGLLGDIPIVSTVYTGDYHHPMDINIVGATGQKMRVISPGSTCMQAIDEPVHKYFHVLYDDGSFERIRLKTRQLLEWQTLNTESDIDHFVSEIDAGLTRAASDAVDDGLPPEIAKPLLWLRYSHHVAAAIRTRVPRAVADRAFLFYKENPPEPVEAVERRREASERGEAKASTLESELHEYLVVRHELELEADSMRLLQSPDPAETLRQLREEALR